MKIRCPNPECNVKFEPESGQKKCSFCGANLFGKKAGLIPAEENGRFICTFCGHRGNPVTMTKGGCGLELGLWLLGILPGLVYSIWRLTTKAKVCPVCEKPMMVSILTPKGQELLKQDK